MIIQKLQTLMCPLMNSWSLQVLLVGNWFVFLDYKRQAAPVVEKYLVPCLSKKSLVL